MLSEFSDNYVTTRNKVRELRLENRDMDESMLISDSESIVKASEQLIKSNNVTYDRILETYAVVEAFEDYYKEIDRNRFTSGVMFTELTREMISHYPKKSHIEKHEAELRAEYDKKLSDEPVKATVTE